MDGSFIKQDTVDIAPHADVVRLVTRSFPLRREDRVTSLRTTAWDHQATVDTAYLSHQ